MEKEIFDLLQTAGLSDLEARVYINGLKSGPISMARLANRIGISRQTAYEAVKKLQEKDLATTNQKEYGKKVYMADLEKIKQYIEKRRNDLEITKDSIQKIISQFQPVSAKLPTVRFFEGMPALKRAWYETLEVKSKKIYVLMPITSMTNMMGKEFNDKYIRERISHKIESHSVRVDDPKNDNVDHKKELRFVRYIPPNIYDISSLFIIFDNKILIITSKVEQVAIIIESKEISSSLMAVWKIVWEQATEK